MSSFINNVPFNLDLLILSNEQIKQLTPVKVLDIYFGYTKNFHSEGLFSTEIFGKKGEERRNTTYSYIDLKLPVFHPILFKTICKLKSLYEGILTGKEYAIFNEKTNDFEKSDVINGKTGYYFFVSNFDKLKFEENKSVKRDFNITLVEKYRKNPFIKYLVVMPAGLRDIELDEDGRTTEDEINTLYREVLGLANTLDAINLKLNEEYANNIRIGLQQGVLKIYLYIKNHLEGKGKLILGKWGSRRIFNSTRNVITSYIPDVDAIDSPKIVSVNETVVGLYQYIKAITPLAIQQVRDTYLSDVFIGPNDPAILVNKKTLTKEYIKIDLRYYDKWMTYQGLEKVFNEFGQKDLRHEYLEVDDYYLGLLYKGSDGTYKFIQDINEVPEDRNKAEVLPITFTELLYLSVYKTSRTIPCLVTRYPITGYGSIYPSYSYLKTTIKSEIRYELDHNWQKTNDKAIEFPIIDMPFYESFSVAHQHIGRLGADFDGDVLSYTCVMSEDAKEEIHKLFNSKKYYVDINNRMAFSANTDIISLILANITG